MSSETALHNTNPPPFDLKSYISQYDPKATSTLQRLLFIAQHPQTSNETTILAYQLLEQQLKEMGNLLFYKDVFQHCPPITATTASGGSSSEDGGKNNLSVFSNYYEEQEERSTAIVYTDDGDLIMNDEGGTNTNLHPKDPSNYGFHYDLNYIQQTQQNFNLQLKQLEANLSTSQSQLSKDAIRQSYLSLSTHYKYVGNVEESWKHLLTAKNYALCLNSVTQNVGLLLEIAIMALENRRLGNVRNHISLAFHNLQGSSSSANNDVDMIHSSSSSPFSPSNEYASYIFYSKLHAISGLCHLLSKKYSEAAKSFIAALSPASSSPQFSTTGSNTNQVSNSHLNNVMSVDDLIFYGGLLSLATMDSSMLADLFLGEKNSTTSTTTATANFTSADKNRNKSSSSFWDKLETIPPLRDAIKYYIRCEYGKCLTLLEPLIVSSSSNHDTSIPTTTTTTIHPELDMYLSPHIQRLWKLIRDKCLVQYFIPYQSISLKYVQEYFPFFTSVEEVEDIVVDLIRSKKLVGVRVDSVNQTLKRVGYSTVSSGNKSQQENVMTFEHAKKYKLLQKMEQVGNDLEMEIESTLLRLSCLESGVMNDVKKLLLSGNVMIGCGSNIGGGDLDVASVGSTPKFRKIRGRRNNRSGHYPASGGGGGNSRTKRNSTMDDDGVVGVPLQFDDVSSDGAGDDSNSDEDDTMVMLYE